MTREEFMTRPSDFGFELNPLDVNLTKIQHNLIKKMEVERPTDDGPFSPIIEIYTSKNPEREYGEIIVIIYRDEDSLTESYYIVEIHVLDKTGDFLTTGRLCRGKWESTMEFIKGRPYSGRNKWDFFSLCKANALWLNYQVKSYREQQRQKAIEEELAKEKGQGLNILICIGTHRDEGQWPAHQLQEVLPEANLQAPKLPMAATEASEVVNDILRKCPDINVVITSALESKLKLGLSSFNSLMVRPTQSLSELGEYVCRKEGTDLNICWRKDEDESLRPRAVNRLSVLVKNILDERIEQYHRECGEYEEVANTALCLYGFLLPKLPNTGWLENKLTEELPVSVQGKNFRLAMTVTPGNEDYVSVEIVMKHPSIRDYICLTDFGKMDDLRELIATREGMYKVFSSAQRLMERWPTPLEEKLSGAKLVETDEFYVVSGEESKIVKLNKNCKLNVMGHTFQGIEDIMSWEGTKPMILEKSKLFPCFDSYDYASENRFYHNYLFCKDEADANEKKPVYDAIPRGYGCVIDRKYPEHLRPLVYYADESNEMTVFY